MTSEQYAILLDRAAEICVAKHAGQRDKSGKAYFLHPMRVALRCTTDDERIVAILHDVVEDTDITAEYLLEQGFPQYIVNAILSVTKQEGESYEEFIDRAKRNSIGRQVKIYDLEDNLNLLRIESVTPEITARLNKYLKARRTLLQEAFQYSSVLPDHAEPVHQSKDDTNVAEKGKLEVE